MTVGCVAEEAPSTEELDYDVNYSTAGEFTPGTDSYDLIGSTEVPLKFEYWYPSSDEGVDKVVYDSVYAGNAYKDVSPDCSSTRPVLMFSHGNAGIRWQSPFFVEHLASHGYVVAAPDHTYNTLFDYDDDHFLEVVERRPQDLADVFEWLVAQSADASSPLYGCVDSEAGYAVAGHSFGGYTAFAAAGALVNAYSTDEQFDYGDERVWASIPMAPWDVGYALTDGTVAIEIPVMVLTGDRDTSTPLGMVTGLYDALSVEPRYFGRFTRAGHYSFSPMACEFGIESDNGCGPDDLELEQFKGWVNTSALAFLESVRGVEGAMNQLPSAVGELSWEQSLGE
jgi:predicted dienelactone hydrolase